MNIWSFTGNLGSDAVRKATAGGTTTLEFSVAVTSGYGKNEKTTWPKCVLFGKRAEGSLGDYLKKGTKVAITGEVTLEEWESKGRAHAMLKVNVNTIDLIGARPEKPAQTVGLASDKELPPSSPQPDNNFFDDDIAF